MRRRILVTSLTALGFIGLVTGAIVTNLNAASGGSAVDSNKPLPPGKSAAAQGSKLVKGALPQVSTASLVQAFSDVGDPRVVAEVKADAINDMQGLRSAMRLPASATDRVAAVSDVVQMAKTAGILQRVMSASSVAQSVADVQAAIRAVASDPTYRAYQDNKFVVDDWQGVKIDGSTASAVLNGHDSYYDAQGWADDQTRQWQLDLQLEGGAWRLKSQKSISIPPSAASSAAKRPSS
jgi:hypothetical protein